MIENWKRAWRMYSVQLATVIFVLGLLQSHVLPMYQLQMSPETYGLLNSVLAVALGLMRLIKQPANTTEPK